MGTSSASAATKFVVTSPTTKAAVPGRVSVSAKLNAKRSAGIVSAKFYVNGKKVTTDNRYPFKVKRGVKFDTRNLPTAKPTVRLSVVFTVRKSNGKLTNRTLKRNVRVKFFLSSNPSVGAQGITPPPAQQGIDGCPVQTQPATPQTQFGYPLVLNDDFAGKTLATQYWNTLRNDSLHGPHNQSGTPFSDLEGAGYSTSNVTVDCGILNLTTSNAPAGGQAKSTGSINSYGKLKFKYGYIETRAKVPKCEGCWPVLFMLPTANIWPPEIDVFEFVEAPGLAEYPYVPFASPHWASDGVDSFPGDPRYTRTTGPGAQEFVNRYFGDVTHDYTEEWHTYGLLWEPGRLQFYFDGQPGPLVTLADAIPNQPMYPIFSMQTGSPSKFGTDTPAGESIQVDYMRVFSANT